MQEAKEHIAEWVKLYTDDMLNWSIYKTKQHAVAEDLVQETFIAAFNSYSKFEGKSSPKTWLFSILRNKITDHYRSIHKLNIVNESEMNGNEDTSILDRLFNDLGHWQNASKPGNWDYDEAELLDNEDFNHVLKSCLELLNENSYLAIQYKYLESKDGKLICKELGITPSNFWQILHRAKLQLRECIEHNWFR